MALSPDKSPPTTWVSLMACGYYYVRSARIVSRGGLWEGHTAVTGWGGRGVGALTEWRTDIFACSFMRIGSGENSIWICEARISLPSLCPFSCTNPLTRPWHIFVASYLNKFALLNNAVLNMQRNARSSTGVVSFPSLPSRMFYVWWWGKEKDVCEISRPSGHSAAGKRFKRMTSKNLLQWHPWRKAPCGHGVQSTS